ncbi:MAG: arylsulfatase [Planctomycetaceae bacterium]|jgi:arylsulfatase|nr:arylsulfatase [Planctomycetaceae bacterium]
MKSFIRIQTFVLRLFGCFLAVVFVSDSVWSQTKSAPRPNIILILADDLGYSDLGCYGGEIKTPNIDRLAAGGLRFKQFYNSTRCCPSRASINTGLYPHQAGVGGMAGHHPNQRGYEGYLTDRCVTTAEVLKSAGYRTYMSGKWHLHEKPNPIDRGFDEFFGLLGGFTSFFNPNVHTRLPVDRPKRQYNPDKYYATDVFTDYALDFLADSRKPDADGKRSPFFLYLAYTAPHFPLHAPKEEIDKYAETYLKGWDAIRAERYARQKTMGVIDENVQLTPRSYVPKNRININTGWADKENPAWETIDADRRADLARRMAVFAAMVDRMDQNIGRVIDDLKKHGDLDNTLILFLSDNGACAEWDPWGFDVNSGPQNKLHKNAELETMGSRGTYHSTGSGWANMSNTPWRLYKHYIQEGGIRTPLVVHWSNGIKRKGEFETSVGHIIDFMPTFVEIAGAKYPKEQNGKSIIPMEGRSLVPAFAGEQKSPRTLFWEHENNRGIREGDTKLVWIEAKGVWELYDLKADSMELTDLAAKQPETVERMSEAWKDWARRVFVTDNLKIDKQPGLKFQLDFSKRENAFKDISGKANHLTVHGTIPATEQGCRFDGNVYIDVPHSESLHCAGTSWTVEVIVTPETKDGVVLACGGSTNGYALAIREGKPFFAVRLNGEIFSLSGKQQIDNKTVLTGKIGKDQRASLSVNGQEVDNRILPKYIERLPNEGTQIGLDKDSQVIDHHLPGFKGIIEQVKIYRGIP